MPSLDPHIRRRRETVKGKQNRLISLITSLDPLVYLPFQDTGSDNPLNYGTSTYDILLNEPYIWQPSTFFPDGSGSLDVTGAGTYISFSSGTKISLTASQTRIAWVRLNSTDATTTYGGNPALTLMGDLTGAVWDGFGVHGGKARFARFNNTAWQTFDSAKSVNDMGVHQIAASYNNSTREVIVYVDGQPDGGGIVSAHQAQGGINRFFLGQGSNDQYLGQAAHMAVWDSVVSPAMILRMWDYSQDT